MPQKIRRLRRLRGPDPRLFLYGDGTWSFFNDEPVHPDVESARRHWNQVRREVWELRNRFSPPRAAEEFDGITHAGLDLLRFSWTHTVFTLEDILAALESDRAAVQAFRQAEPRGAGEIADILDEWLEDLDNVEREAQRIARGPEEGHTFPSHPELDSPWRFGELLGAA